MSSIKRELSLLKPLLTSWKEVIKEYAERSPDDCAYWYGERPQVGFLSVAAWRLKDEKGNKGVALEEWGTTKGSHEESSYGRNDLWIGWGKKGFSIEAKHCWCSINKSEEVIKKDLQACIAKAKDSARRMIVSDEDKLSRRLAAVFVSAVWKEDRPPVDSSRKKAKALKLWEKICKKQADTGLVEIVSDNPPMATEPSDAECIGIALLLFEVKSK